MELWDQSPVDELKLDIIYKNTRFTSSIKRIDVLLFISDTYSCLQMHSRHYLLYKTTLVLVLQ